MKRYRTQKRPATFEELDAGFEGERSSSQNQILSEIIMNQFIKDYRPMYEGQNPRIMPMQFQMMFMKDLRIEFGSHKGKKIGKLSFSFKKSEDLENNPRMEVRLFIQKMAKSGICEHEISDDPKIDLQSLTIFVEPATIYALWLRFKVDYHFEKLIQEQRLTGSQGCELIAYVGGETPREFELEEVWIQKESYSRTVSIGPSHTAQEKVPEYNFRGKTVDLGPVITEKLWLYRI